VNNEAHELKPYLMNLNKIILLSIFVLGLSLMSSSIQAQRSLKIGALEVLSISDFDFVYADNGTGANKDLSIWKPQLPPGFSALGHYAHANYSKPTSGVVLAIRATDDYSVIAYPVDYQQIYNDAGTGGDQDGSIWMPIAPAGYVALGMVGMNGHGKPHREAVVCVREDLTTPVGVGEMISNDQGSGGNLDLFVWGIATPGVGAGLLGSGSFCAHRSYARPSNSPVCNALKK